MKRCSFCSTEIEDQAKSCAKCGKPYVDERWVQYARHYAAMDDVQRQAALERLSEGQRKSLAVVLRLINAGPAAAAPVAPVVPPQTSPKEAEPQPPAQPAAEKQADAQLSPQPATEAAALPSVADVAIARRFRLWPWIAGFACLATIILVVVAVLYFVESQRVPAPLTVQAANRIGEQAYVIIQERGLNANQTPNPKLAREIFIASFEACGYDFEKTLEKIAERPLYAYQHGGWIAFGSAPGLETEEDIRQVYTPRETELILTIRKRIGVRDESGSRRPDNAVRPDPDERVRLEEALDLEAKEAAQQIWSHFVVKCGDSTFYVFLEGEEYGTPIVIEGKGEGSLNVQGRLGTERNQADILNGVPDIAWEGTSELSFAVWRAGYLENDGVHWWNEGKWREGSFDTKLEFIKENGHWKFKYAKMQTSDCDQLR